MLEESEKGQELFGLEPSPRPGAHRRSLRERSALPCAGGSVVFLPCPLAVPWQPPPPLPPSARSSSRGPCLSF